MSVRFNAPPGWPALPADWSPPPGWRAEPDWPEAPPGWHFWTATGPGGELTMEPSLAGTTRVPEGPIGLATQTAPPAPIAPPSPPAVLVEPAVPETGPAWNPTWLDPPTDLHRWQFNPPPGWSVPSVAWKPPAGWGPAPSWPAAPVGWRFWDFIPERFHVWMALSTLITGSLCIPSFNGGTPASVFLGIVLLASAVGAFVVSRGFTRVRDLTQPAKAYVWVIAFVGGAFGICGVLGVYLPLKAYDWYRRNS